MNSCRYYDNRKQIFKMIHSIIKSLQAYAKILQSGQNCYIQGKIGVFTMLVSLNASFGVAGSIFACYFFDINTLTSTLKLC